MCVCVRACVRARVSDFLSLVLRHAWTNYKFGDFSDWVNVFKPGTGTITVWENTGGTRGAVLYQKKGIPLTPGPLMVVIKGGLADSSLTL